MATGGFDKISSLYDGLARLVYGRSIINAQQYYLEEIPLHAKVLILGGGTGWLLAALIQLKPDCEVWYIEASAKMIERAKRKSENNLVHFIHGTENDIPSSIKFDAVITNFYLDLFTEKTLSNVIHKIKCSVKPTAYWLIADFVNNKKWWHILLLKSMYLFFGVFCHIEASTLPNWHFAVQQSGFTKMKSKLFYQGFIESAVYSNTSSEFL